MTKKQIGKALRKIRLANKVSKYKVIKDGLNKNLIDPIENATTNYTIDTLLNYMKSVGAELKVEKIKK